LFLEFLTTFKLTKDTWAAKRSQRSNISFFVSILSPARSRYRYKAAVDLRRPYRMRLPDALIWATALELGHTLITRNSRDFPPEHPGIRLPYQVSVLHETA